MSRSTHGQRTLQLPRHSLTTAIDYVPTTTRLSTLLVTLGVALSGLVNAVLLGRLARTLRAQPPRPATTPQGRLPAWNAWPAARARSARPQPR
ncbi:SCO4225 family membrane protein [Streptomyces sp. NPDC001809]